MKCILIMVGTELLNGNMLDTNSLFIAEECNKYGIEIESRIVVRDVIEEIEKAILFAKSSAELVIMSGGLGPTIDDLTKVAISNVLKKELVVEEEDRLRYLEKYKVIRKDFVPTNFKEVEKPIGSYVIVNEVGLADCIFIDGIAAFPGVPRELYHLLPKFMEFYSEKYLKVVDKIYIKDLNTMGIGELQLEELVKDSFTEENIFYEFLVKDYGTVIRLQGKESNKNNVEKITKKLYNIAGEYIFGEDNERLEEILVNLLSDKKLQLSTVESCTGGMIASKIIDVPGASNIFLEGLVTYSNSAKVDRVGVSNVTLDNFGAVSHEVAREMTNLKSDVVIATTGIAGPGGGSVEKPVGLVYIATKVKDDVLVKKYNFFGNRKRIRERATNMALFQCINMIKKRGL